MITKHLASRPKWPVFPPIWISPVGVCSGLLPSLKHYFSECQLIGFDEWWWMRKNGPKIRWRPTVIHTERQTPCSLKQLRHGIDRSLLKEECFIMHFTNLHKVTVIWRLGVSNVPWICYNLERWAMNTSIRNVPRVLYKCKQCAMNTNVSNAMDMLQS